MECHPPGVSVLVQELINLREAALGLILGRDDRDVLNRSSQAIAGAPKQPLAGHELAASLKRAVNAFKATAIDDAGLTVDYRRLGASPAYDEYWQRLTPQLQAFDPTTLATRDQRLAFWINLYNALVIDAVIAYGVRTSVTTQWAGLAFFRQAAYLVGGRRCSLEAIEHGILRANRGSPFLPGPQFAPDDPRLAWIVEPFEPRIHFALNCASRSCPPIGVYSAEQIETQLQLATRSFVDADVEVDLQRGELHLSRIFSWYSDDFGGPAGIVELLRGTLPDDQRRAWLREARSARLVYRNYDWRLNSVRGQA